MGSVSHRPKFDPADLELIDRVYAVACAYIEARDLYRDVTKDVEEEAALRTLMFISAGDGRLEFDTLCDTVLASIVKYREGSIPSDRLAHQSVEITGHTPIGFRTPSCAQ